MKLFNWIVLIVAAVTMTMGCVQTERSSWNRRGKAIRVSEPVYDIKAVKMSDSTVKLSFVGTPTLRTDGQKVGWVEAAIGPSEDQMIDSVVFKVVSAGAPGSPETLQLVGEADWQSDAAKKADRAVMDVSVVTAKEHIIYRVTTEFVEADPMELTAFTSPASDSIIDIGVIARRVFIPPGEYLPTSENFRVIISDKNGTVVFRTDAVGDFLPFVSLVEPQTIGQMQRFAIPWNGKDLSGTPVPEGEYQAEILIPAHPTPYRTTVMVPWPPK